MSKLFFEVFPTLVVNEEMKKLLSEMEITRVSANRSKTSIRIYLFGSHLIHKANIFQLEKDISNQLFPSRHMDIKIVEKFQLSSQYTAEKLLHIYEDSIADELKNYSLLLYNVYRNGKMNFTDERSMQLVLEDTIIARERSDELVRILEKIFCERCGMDLIVQLSFEKPKESSRIKNADLIIEQEIKNVVRMSAFSTKPSDNGEETEHEEKALPEKSAKEPVKNQTAKVPEKKPEFKKEFRNKRDSYSSRRSDNPDVVYGRDFDDEVITIDKIVGEMGEVAIRGQVISLDTREIRNEKTIIIISVTDFTDTIVLKIFSRNEDVPELLESIKKDQRSNDDR